MVNMEDLYNQYTSKQQIQDSFDKFTAQTGRYTFAATKVEVRTGESDHVIEALRDRPYVSIFGRLTEEVDGQTKKRGSVGFDASWEPRKDKKGNPDKPSKLWGQLVVAFDMKEKSVGDTVDAAKMYPLSVYVNESFKTPEGYRTARDADARSGYRKLGYVAKNFVESISRA